MADEQIPPGGTRVDDPAWQAWSPPDIARLLAGVRVPWYVAGVGWALNRVHPGHAWIGPFGGARPDPPRRASA